MRKATALLPVCTAVLALTGCMAKDVTIDKDVSYDDRYGGSTQMDVYRPDGPLVPRPGVLMIHGGGWSAYTKDTMAEDARRLAGAGYVVFNINYRLVPDGAFPRDVQDCLCALAYARAHADQWGLDPSRIATLGYSAGGHLASLLGVAADEPALASDCAAGTTGPPIAVVSGAGPQDFRTEPEADTIKNYLGGSKGDRPDTYALASPITHVSPSSPPFLFVQGEDDLFVGPQQSKTMRDALDAAGVETRMLLVPGGGHVWNRGPDGDSWELVLTSIDTPEAQAAIVDFLDHAIGPVP